MRRVLEILLVQLLLLGCAIASEQQTNTELAGDRGVNPVQNQRPGRQREIALRDQLEYSAKVMAALQVGGDAQSTYRPRAGGKGGRTADCEDVRPAKPRSVTIK
jgi:hypothetical protein